MLLTNPTKLRPRVQFRDPSGTAPQARHPSSPPYGGVHELRREGHATNAPPPQRLVVPAGALGKGRKQKQGKQQ
jgi:hypothetical protein